jgi:hypothetical protein
MLPKVVEKKLIGVQLPNDLGTSLERLGTKKFLKTCIDIPLEMGSAP